METSLHPSSVHTCETCAIWQNNRCLTLHNPNITGGIKWALEQHMRERAQGTPSNCFRWRAPLPSREERERMEEQALARQAAHVPAHVPQRLGRSEPPLEKAPPQKAAPPKTDVVPVNGSTSTQPPEIKEEKVAPKVKVEEAAPDKRAEKAPKATPKVATSPPDQKAVPPPVMPPEGTKIRACLDLLLSNPGIDNNTLGERIPASQSTVRKMRSTLRRAGFPA